MEKYYKAYEERYKNSYDMGLMWETNKYSGELLNVINKYNISKDKRVLDLGCGEGRDAIYLLDQGYNISALDYSVSVINKINEITNNKYKDKFFQFDIIEDKLNKKYDFIYSIAVLHMFILDSDREKYLEFIYDHLENDGYAFIVCMGDGIKEFSTDINEAFNLKSKVNINSGKEIYVASTSCRIVNWDNLVKELNNNKLEVVDKYISTNIPNFDKVMCVIVRKL